MRGLPRHSGRLPFSPTPRPTVTSPFIDQRALLLFWLSFLDFAERGLETAPSLASFPCLSPRGFYGGRLSGDDLILVLSYNRSRLEGSKREGGGAEPKTKKEREKEKRLS